MSKRSRRRARMSHAPRPTPTTALAALPPLGAPSPAAPAVNPRRAVTPPVKAQGGGVGWSLETIRSARDMQLRGQFAQPVRLAEAFRTNDALFTAYQARVATQSSIKMLWQPADTDAGRVACKRAEHAIHAPVHTREGIHGTLANHGIAIGYVLHETVDDPDHGPTVCMTLTEWPLEHVRYNPSTCTLETRTRENGTITIVHGDGRWIVFSKFGVAPWTQDACVLPGALLWAAHGGAISDWSAASFSHGQPKVIGIPREGLPLGDGQTLTPEAQSILDTLAALVGGESGAGVLPSGSEAKLLFNGSTAWQVFDALVINREKAAQRIYNGTDAALGSQGGAPGVDIGVLFGVANTRIQGDLEALERGLREGMLAPWMWMHAVQRADAFKYTYAMPDTDGERRSEQEAKAIERLAAMVKQMKDSGFEVTDDTIAALVLVLGVSVPCVLAAVETRAIPLQLAPTDVAKVVTVNEARAAQGLPPRDGGDITIAEQDAMLARASAAPPAEGEEPTEDAPPTEDDDTDAEPQTEEAAPAP
jgi:hypothetical protein